MLFSWYLGVKMCNSSDSVIFGGNKGLKMENERSSYPLSFVSLGLLGKFVWNIGVMMFEDRMILDQVLKFLTMVFFIWV